MKNFLSGCLSRFKLGKEEVPVGRHTQVLTGHGQRKNDINCRLVSAILNIKARDREGEASLIVPGKEAQHPVRLTKCMCMLLLIAVNLAVPCLSDGWGRWHADLVVNIAVQQWVAIDW